MSNYYGIEIMNTIKEEDEEEDEALIEQRPPKRSTSVSSNLNLGEVGHTVSKTRWVKNTTVKYEDFQGLLVGTRDHEDHQMMSNDESSFSKFSSNQSDSSTGDDAFPTLANKKAIFLTGSSQDEDQDNADQNSASDSYKGQGQDENGEQKVNFDYEKLFAKLFDGEKKTKVYPEVLRSREESLSTYFISH